MRPVRNLPLEDCYEPRWFPSRRFFILSKFLCEKCRACPKFYVCKGMFPFEVYADTLTNQTRESWKEVR